MEGKKRIIFLGPKLVEVGHRLKVKWIHVHITQGILLFMVMWSAKVYYITKYKKIFLNGNNAETDKYFNNAVSGTKTLNI